MRLPLTALLLIFASLSIADTSLSDQDVEEILEVAALYVPGQVLSMHQTFGRHRDDPVEDRDVWIHVHLAIARGNGYRVLRVSKVGGEWKLTKAERERVEIERYRDEQKADAVEPNTQSNQSLQQTGED